MMSYQSPLTLTHGRACTVMTATGSSAYGCPASANRFSGVWATPFALGRVRNCNRTRRQGVTGAIRAKSGLGCVFLGLSRIGGLHSLPSDAGKPSVIRNDIWELGENAVQTFDTTDEIHSGLWGLP